MADTIKASPRGVFSGTFADMLKSGKESLNKYEVKDWVPLLGGTGLGDLIMQEVPELAEDVSYQGVKALIKGGNVATGGIGTFAPDKRTLDAAMLGSDFAGILGIAKTGGKVAVKKIAEEVSKPTAQSRREFVKKAGATAAGATIGAGMLRVLGDIGKEGAEQTAKKATDNVAVTAGKKYKYNTLAEYNADLSKRAEDIYWNPEDIDINKGSLADIKRELAIEDEMFYNDIKQVDQLYKQGKSGHESYDQFQRYENYKGVLNEFSPQAKAEMKAFKNTSKSFNNLDEYIFAGGFGGLTYRQMISRGTETAKEVFDEKILSRRLTEPGNEGGMHVTVDRNTSEPMMYNYDTGEKGTHITMKSNVRSPYWVEDTGGTWTPAQMIQQISKANLNPNGTKKLSDKAIAKLNKIYRDYDEAIGGDRMTVPLNKLSQIENKYNKEVQKVLKDNGYDHISYINKREGEPVESAIIFDREDVEFLHAE
jgi:hypothetical protein